MITKLWRDFQICNSVPLRHLLPNCFQKKFVLKKLASKSMKKKMYRQYLLFSLQFTVYISHELGGNSQILKLP